MLVSFEDKKHPSIITVGVQQGAIVLACADLIRQFHESNRITRIPGEFVVLAFLCLVRLNATFQQATTAASSSATAAGDRRVWSWSCALVLVVWGWSRLAFHALPLVHRVLCGTILGQSIYLGAEAMRLIRAQERLHRKYPVGENGENDNENPNNTNSSSSTYTNYDNPNSLDQAILLLPNGTSSPAMQHQQLVSVLRARETQVRKEAQQQREWTAAEAILLSGLPHTNHGISVV
jgi:hypothetical protein